MKTTIGWISDTHIDYNQYGRESRRKDFAFAMSSAIDDMIANGVHGILHTGDLFNSNRPSSEAIRFIQDIHSRLIAARVHMLVVPGNHDYTDPSWLDILSPDPGGGILQLDRGTRFKLRDITVAGYESMSRDALVKSMTEDNLAGVDILMLHQLVKEFIGFPPPNALSIADIPSGFQLVALGDIHVNKIMERVVGGLIGYPGSTEMSSTSEDERKYWVQLNFDHGKLDSYVNQQVRSRPVWRWNITDDKSLHEYLDGSDAQLELLKLRDARPPMVIVEFPTTLPEVLTRVRAKLDPDKFIIVEVPRYEDTGEHVDTDPQNPEPEDFTIDDVLRMVINTDDKLYSIASQMLHPDTDAKVAVASYVETRMKEINASSA